MIDGINRIMLCVLLAVIAYVDYKEKKIPNKLLLAGMAGRSVLLLWEAAAFPDRWRISLMMSAAGLLFGLLFLLLLSFLTKHGIGYGDVKLFAWIGWCVGMKECYYILFYSVLWAALAGGFLLLVKKADRKQMLPFAPFVLLGYGTVLCSLI